MHQRLTDNGVLTEKEIERLDKLLKRHERRLIHYINSLVGNYADADDILSIAFIKAFNGYHNVRDKENISSWLHRICYRAVMDFFRWEKKDEDRLTELVADSGWSIEERVIFEHSIAGIIGELPQNYQTPLLLDHSENFTLAEGAEELNISLTAYKSRLYRGRETLKEKMELSYLI